ncbi:MAG: glycosyltransferase family 1 protein [Candidatus Omnitrophota bacterium]
MAFPHYNIPLVRPAGMKLVTTIHDLIHWIYRKQFFSPLQGFYAGQMLRRSVRDSDQILTVSEQTRRDLVTHFRADPEKISVIPEGVGARFTQGDRRGAGERMKSRYAIPGDYFLYVGLLKPHKNVLWLFDLFKRLRGEGKIRSSLVLVGRKNERYPAGYERYSEIESGHGIIYHSGVDSNDLVELYRGALALVHPSLYEGFGLTLLEAMACGTPVAAFRAASIPEVCADAACLVSPGSEEEMTRALERLENEPSLREELSRKGLLRAGQFRWEETAAKTIRVYEKVLR